MEAVSAPSRTSKIPIRSQTSLAMRKTSQLPRIIYKRIIRMMRMTATRMAIIMMAMSMEVIAKAVKMITTQSARYRQIPKIQGKAATPRMTKRLQIRRRLRRQKRRKVPTL